MDIFDGKSFYRLDFRHKTWADAKDICDSDGAHLVSLQTVEEYNALKPYLQAYGHDSYWIGGRQVENSNDVYWETGDRLAINLWGNGQPEYQNDHMCISFWSGTQPSSYLMDDDKCTKNHPFICEKNI